MKRILCFLVLYGSASAYDVITFGPNINFKNGFRVYSFGFEIAYWKTPTDYPDPIYGLDIGVEWFRDISANKSGRTRPDGLFRKNIRIYSEAQVGQMYYGASLGPFLEIKRSVLGNKINLGIQSTLWGNWILGLDFRPSLSFEGFGLSYGPYLRIGECTEPCL